MGGDADSRARTIEGHLPLVRSVARRYLRSGEPLEDLVQVGTIGLIKAVDRFDPRRDTDLAALARPAIEGEIRHHLRGRRDGVRVPRPDRELAARLHAERTELTATLRRTPTVAEVATAAGVDEQHAARVLEGSDAGPAVPLDADGDAGPARTHDGDGDLEAAETRALLASAWSVLDERERRLLDLRYNEDRSQAEIARELGLSQAHVSRLLRAALERLRTEVAGEHAVHGMPAAAPVPVRSGRLLLRMPQSLHADLAAAAQREGVPLNTYITTELATTMSRTAGPAEPPARGRPTLLVVNAVVIALAALAGLALLLAAWLA